MNSSTVKEQPVRKGCDGVLFRLWFVKIPESENYLSNSLFGI